MEFEPEPAVDVPKRRIFLSRPDFQGLHTDGDKPRGLACPHIYFRNSFPRLAERHRFFSQPLPLDMDNTGSLFVRWRGWEKKLSSAWQEKGCGSNNILLEVGFCEIQLSGF